MTPLPYLVARIFKLEEQLHSKVVAEEKLEHQRMVGQDEVHFPTLCSVQAFTYIVVMISVAVGCSLLVGDIVL